MGQQQLLLLVLAIVIVGIATVAGIQAFSEGNAKAKQDAAVSDAMRIITDIQAWKMKPSAFGGGDNKNWNQVGFSALGITDTTSNGEYKTINGCYEFGAGSATQAELVVYSDTSCTNKSTTQIASVVITDTNPDGIAWSY